MKKYLIYPAILVLLLTGCISRQAAYTPKTAFKSYTRALESYQAGRFPTALGFIKKSLAANDRFAGYYELMGDIYARMDSLEPALMAYDKALERRSHNYRVLEKSGDINFALHRFQQAVEAYQKAFAQNDSALYLLLKQAESRLQTGMVNVGINVLQDYKQRARASKKHLTYAYYKTHARLMFEKGKYYIVAIDFRAAERLQPLDRNSLLLYIQSHFNTDQLEEGYFMATDVYKRFLKPADVHYFRALYYLKQKNIKDGMTQLKLAVKKGCEIPDAYGMLRPSVRKQQPPPGIADRLLNVGFDFKGFLTQSLPPLQKTEAGG